MRNLRTARGRLVASAAVIVSSFMLGGCNSMPDSVSKSVSEFFFGDDQFHAGYECRMKGNMDLCRLSNRLADLEGQCRNWKSGLACAEYGKVFAYGEGIVKPDKKKAQEMFDQGCELKSEDSCKLAKLMKEGRMPETAEEVLPGLSVSTHETRRRSFVAGSLGWITWTCPGSPSEDDLKAANNLKEYAKLEYPELHGEYPEYWTPGMGTAFGRDKSWYMRQGFKLARRPGTETAGFWGWLLSD
jgi:hypothetical protein